MIAIIAILAAMLLPALARAKAQGQKTRCVNNLKQLGLANRMYADDSNDRMAQPNWDGGANAAAPQGWLYSMNPTSLPPGAPAGQVPNPYDIAYWKVVPQLANQTGLWYKYSPNPAAYLCPVDTTSKSFTTPTAAGGRNNKLSTYVMNGAVVGYTGGNTPMKLSDAWSTQCCLIWEPDENALGPGNPGAFEWNDAANYPDTANGESIGLYHSKNAGNALALDGHVVNVTRANFKQWSTLGSGPGPGGKTYLWWDNVNPNGR